MMPALGYNSATFLDCILFLFALMTTIMTDLERTTLHCNIAASSSAFAFCYYLSGPVLHAREKEGLGDAQQCTPSITSNLPLNRGLPIQLAPLENSLLAVNHLAAVFLS